MRRKLPLSLHLGAALTLLLVAVALLSLLWTPYPAEQVRVIARLKPPSAAHWLGTDHFGRDVLSMIMVGARNSLAVGAAAVGLGLLGGVPLGLLAAGLGRWGDEVVARLGDLVFAFPAVLTAILLTAALGAGAVNVVVALALFNAAVLARVTRGAALAVWRRPFVGAALALGRGPLSATLVHVLPNIAGIVVVQATVLFAVAIVNEAALSYLGLGIQPPSPSWGKMLGDAQTYLFTAPLQAVFPGVAIALSVMGLTMLGDGLRDWLDPRHRSSGVM
ncbi:peptide/nickel transport system permease protein [Azospirillum lipoferum]|uniref:ABC transporter permease n=1 Tax=Azospirillum lipoferum TaxID=193 RepID=A0A5A9GCB6_AZOLI|nr:MULTISPECIES: ABC transporter permease [Azospirillum]KAA0591997.1 ABC transporter permease [Azospirillum lipoferum]MCP1612130.1 peptide/nickel transport system permease protein [Azospirillum lipoferum]MDW5536643.1 ABC transporter permease [Azospirillum sp. NL1]